VNGTLWKNSRTGKVYKVRFLATHTETKEDMVVYALKDDATTFYVRPLENWHGENRDGNKRFVPV